MRKKPITIWMFSAYDQPNGNSSRTDEFAYFLGQHRYKVKFITNNFCHFKKTHTKKVTFLWTKENIKNYEAVWLKTSSYDSNIGFLRVVNMWQNAYKTFLHAICCKEKPKVIIAPSVPITLGFVACVLAKIFRCRMIYEIRDLWPEILVDIGAIRRNNILFKILKRIELFIYKHCDAIVSTLPNVADYIKINTKQNILIEYIPNGIVPKKLKIKKNKTRKSLKTKKIMYFGGYGLDHDIETILKSAKILKQKYKNKFVFLLYGDGPKKDQMKLFAKQEKIDNAFFNQPVPKEKIPYFSKTADLLLVAITDSPSYRFGINLNKILSYFMCMKPILFAGNVTNNPVKAACAGLCVPAGSPEKMASAIEKVFSLRACHRLRMAQNGYNFALKNLHVNILGEKYLRLLNYLN